MLGRSLRDEETSARQALSIVLREQTDFFKAPQHLVGGKEAQFVHLSRVANSTGPVDLIVEPEARQTVLDLSLAHPNDPYSPCRRCPCRRVSRFEHMRCKPL